MSMVKELLKRQLAPSVYAALRTLWLELRIQRWHQRSVRVARQWRGRNDLKLHLGCGKTFKPGWINIDLWPHADLALDMRRPLPFEDGSCALIYSEHFLEHIDYPEPVVGLLRECYRVLRPGGVFSVGVPDTEWPIAEYAGLSHQGYFETAKRQWHPAWCQTEMEHLNFHFRQGDEHRFAYDFKTLRKALVGVGFELVVARDFDADLDSAGRALGTLYVDATKGSGQPPQA
jgi:predicted SAM-dependent methyltransferase